MGRGLVVAGLVALVWSAVASTAGAGTYSSENLRLVYRGGNEQNKVTWQLQPDKSVIADSGSLMLPPLDDLDTLLQTLQACPGLLFSVTCIDNGTGIPPIAALGGGNDTIATSGGGERVIEIYDGPGADRIVGSAPREIVDASAGPDDVVGGGGMGDRIQYFANTDGRGIGPISVTLDNVANDGSPGEGDNIHGDVEEIYVADASSTTIVGSNASNLLKGGYPGPSNIQGLAGNDDITGNDQVDVLDGGPGEDTITAYGAADTINVRDGEVDHVDCGLGVDIVTADAADVLTGCENVDLP